MILVLTPYSFKPIHPRLEYIEKYLLKNGYKVKKYNLKCTYQLVNKLNWFSLTFFQIPSLFKSIKYIWKYRKTCDIIFIQDLQYLPISLVSKIFGKKVIYDTLDNNVELNFYHVSNRFIFIKKYVFIKNIVSFLEKKISKYFCDEIIVNSKALREYFKPEKVNLIYYTSPFENMFNVDINKEKAFLYLGVFSEDKGANEILEFVSRYNLKLYIYGDTTPDILKKILINKNIVYKDKLSSQDLMKDLKVLFDSYALIGFSLIKDVHYSYATQEANKDIDYLAMGIPLIGNNRQPTKEKINSDCGVFIDNKVAVEKLLEDKLFYKFLSNNCIEYYNKYYSQNIFEKKLIKVIKNV